MSSVFTGFAVDTLAYALHQSLDECLDGLAAQGCRAVQLSLHPGFLWPAELDGAARQALRRRIAERGLSIAAVNLPGVEVNVASVSAEMRQYSLDLLRQNIELAGDLGASAIVLAPGRQHPLVPLPRAALMSLLQAALDVLVPLATRRGTTVCVENAPSSFLPDAEGVLTAVRRCGHAETGICYDLANGHFITEDIGAALRRLAPWLKLIHVADTPREAHRHAAIGQGSIAFADLAPVLREIRFAGPVVLEVISDDAVRDIAASARALAAMGWGISDRHG